MVLLVGTFIFIGSNVKEEEYTVSETSKRSKKKNKETKEESSAENTIVKEGGEAIAREIADDDSIFEINTDKYAEYSMEYATTLVDKRVIQEISGIYLGNTEEGKPDGYGLFYYRMEYTVDSFGKYIDDFIYFGEWEAGSLKEGKTVKKRYRHYSERDKSNSCYILNGEWEKGDFNGNPEGKYIEEVNNSNGEWEEVLQAEGVFEGGISRYFIVKGTEYRDSMFGGKLKYEGDFNNGMLYNGTVYDENGNVQWTVVDGETHH